MDRFDLTGRELSLKMTAAYNYGLSSAGIAPDRRGANLSGRFLVAKKLSLSQNFCATHLHFRKCYAERGFFRKSNIGLYFGVHSAAHGSPRAHGFASPCVCSLLKSCIKD